MFRPNEILVPLDEARAAIGNPSRTDFYRLIFDGMLEARKLGPRVMVTGSSLLALPEKLRTAPVKRGGGATP
jgi:hypothetical protein